MLDEAEKIVGCPMVFTLVECCREWLDNEGNVVDDTCVTDTASLSTQSNDIRNANDESAEILTENAILAWIRRNEELSSEGIIEKMLDMAEDINSALKKLEL